MASVYEIFEQVCDLPTDKRGSELDRLCRDNTGLRDEVDSLLKAHDGAGDFLKQPTLDHPDIAETLNAPSGIERPGTVIGPYKLLEQIGEGGFGTVFMAQQDAPIRRRVALKILKPGMDTKQVIARFESERQALALMDHPNIARVIDAGSTTSGRPFFVMELVRGEAITTFCNQRDLSVSERLSLFQDVCFAVAHAHQKGIIHRDIKPSNVLVTVSDDKPLVKVIDFGIAKATTGPLTDKTLFTEFRQLLGTPLYMSPEQAEQSGVDVDTRTDVYSLGVLLYEILTGRTPLDPKRLSSAAWAEVQKMILEEEPSRPSVLVSSLRPDILPRARQRTSDASHLSQLLRGDLDWIILKAIEKDRSRRYPTVNELAADIDRYLLDQPVEATPPSRIYQLRKFVRRHRGLFTAGVAVLVTLLIGLAATGYTAKVALDQKARAEARERQAVRAATAAGASVLLSEADAMNLANGWRQEIAEIRGAGNESEALLSETQFTVWMASWLAMNHQADQAEESIGKIYDRARQELGYSNPAFFALCNLRIQINEANHRDAKLSADCYADLLQAVAANSGEDQTVPLLPQYAEILVRADRTDQAVEQLNRYITKQSERPLPLSQIDMKRLQAAIDSLMSSGQIEMKLLQQVRALCETGSVASAVSDPQDDPELAADLQTLQGCWRNDFWKNGMLVERMRSTFDGTNCLTEWLDDKDQVIRGRSGRFELSRSGGVKVITIYLDSSSNTGGAFVYRLGEKKLRTVSGLLLNQPSIPDVELRVFNRVE
ncbi:MAG: serine/threonine protein kinase [Planctomycetales bacterium]|nr:serine/threonine protein kinase [Planctomycetales bacterium]